MSSEPPATLAPDGLSGPSVGLHVALSVVAGTAATVVWVEAGGEDRWPRWVWFGLGVGVVAHVLLRRALRAARTPGQAYRTVMEALAAIAVVDVSVWLLAGGGSFYPVWSLTGYGVVAAVVTAIVHRHRLPWAEALELEERVDVLTRTRSGALDVQAQQLRRIERDLHDGAQVRLVALTMQLGRAEARLEAAGDPQTLALVRGARDEVSAAIGELRDLARGIAPPVLADRGLPAAAEALGRRAVSPVEVEAELDRRPPPVVESAAYFVIAESLANASKHVPGAPVRVAVREEDGVLVVVVQDDGPGGADPGGSGLTGLRHRVEALDGRLTVTSAPGAGTVVRAELPCGS